METETAAILPDQDVSMESKPHFAPISASESTKTGTHYRKILVPANRRTPLKRDWPKLYAPIVQHLQLQIRYDPKSYHIHLRTGKTTPEVGYLQRAADFLRAYLLGFEVDDAVAMLRMDDLYIDSFEIKDVKTLNGDHLARAIGRIAGKDGRTRFAIENTSKTRIVLADTRIHILGTVQNIKVARDAVVSLILGSPPGKVYANLRTVAARLKDKF